MKIDFTFMKNNEYIINSENIKCINNNSLHFVIDHTKYKLTDKVLEKETEDDIVILDFNTNNCKVILKKENYCINLNIKVIKYEKRDNILKIEYISETEDDIINTIIIKYKKS